MNQTIIGFIYVTQQTVVVMFGTVQGMLCMCVVERLLELLVLRGVWRTPHVKGKTLGGGNNINKGLVYCSGWRMSEVVAWK